MSAPLLEVEGLSISFGGLRAVEDVSFEVAKGEIVALIGPNGAGKTTVFNCISGFYKAGRGRIRFCGENIEKLPSHKIARRGLLRTFQNIRLFPGMTALENLLVARHHKIDASWWSGLLLTPGYRRAMGAALEEAAYWLEALDLTEVANRSAGTLPYGLQRRLEIARCMMARPKLLLLDEPAAGLNPRETAALDELIVRLRAEHGLTVLLIEHDMRLVMGLSDRIVVLDYGQVIAAGTPEAVRRDPRVIKAYLGES